MWRPVFVLTAISLCLSNAALPLPTYIKPCARTDPDFNKCALKSARETIPQVVKGDRKYRVPALDPLEIKELKIADSGPRQAGLALVMTNAKVYGVKDSYLEKTDFDFDKKHVHHEMALKRLEILGKYNVAGRVLLLPISGNGDINITLENVQVSYDHDYTLQPIKGDGELYMVISNTTSTLVPKLAHIHLTNLFNGDPLLGNQMNVFLQENWQVVYEELSPAVITAFTEIVNTIIRGIAGSVPFNVAFPQKLPAD